MLAAEAAKHSPQILTPTTAAFDVLSRFSSVLESLQKNYVQPSKTDDANHTTVALREFVRSVDPDADLLTVEELAKTLSPPSENVGDLGLYLAIRNDYPTVISTREGSTAQSAGLLSGDQVIELNGKSTRHARLFDMQQQLRGPSGSKIELRALDPVTGKTRDLNIEYAVPQPPVSPSLKFLGNGIAYYRVPEFSVAVIERLHMEIKRAETERARTLILDLRNNASGSFEAAQVAARIFLAPSTEIVSLEYANPGFRTTFVSDSSKKFAPPLVLLVNGGTASEAEIFAAALRDNNRARLVGSKTFGKGVLTTQFSLPDGNTLDLPTAYYMRPSKKIFHGIGLTPDVEVQLPRETERSLATAGFGTFDWSNDKSQVLATDLPLAKALELLAK